jgi:hypothetical protein
MTPHLDDELHSEVPVPPTFALFDQPAGRFLMPEGCLLKALVASKRRRDSTALQTIRNEKSPSRRLRRRRLA